MSEQTTCVHHFVGSGCYTEDWRLQGRYCTDCGAEFLAGGTVGPTGDEVRAAKDLAERRLAVLHWFLKDDIDNCIVSGASDYLLALHDGIDVEQWVKGRTLADLADALLAAQAKEAVP